MAHNLSEDLLYAIFLHALPSEFNLTTIGPSNEPWMVPPFSFSSVCRSWRAVVLSHPMLWSKISVTGRILVPWSEDNLRTIIRQILKKWLNHSSSAPLWIQLNIDEDHRAYVPDHILPLFLQEINRWSFVDIRVTSYKTTSTRNPTSFSLQCPTSLRSLSLKLFGNSSPAICVDLSRQDAGSLLEHLSLGIGVSVRLPDDRNALRLPRLRSFHSRYTKEGKDLEDLRCILSTCSSLEGLELQIEEKSISSTVSIQGSAYLPNLTSLLLLISNGFASRYILDILTLPSLREFSLIIHTRDEVEGDHAFLEPLRIRESLLRSCPNPPLQALCLGGVDVHNVGPNYAAALQNLLVSLRNLKILDLRMFALNRAVLEMLTIATEELDFQLCPSLSEIRLLHDCSRQESDISAESIEMMVASRWKAGSLRAVTFRLSHSRFAMMKEREQIAECIREGLEITDVDMDWLS